MHQAIEQLRHEWLVARSTYRPLRGRRACQHGGWWWWWWLNYSAHAPKLDIWSMRMVILKGSGAAAITISLLLFLCVFRSFVVNDHVPSALACFHRHATYIPHKASRCRDREHLARGKFCLYTHVMRWISASLLPKRASTHIYLQSCRPSQLLTHKWSSQSISSITTSACDPQQHYNRGFDQGCARVGTRWLPSILFPPKRAQKLLQKRYTAGEE